MSRIEADPRCDCAEQVQMLLDEVGHRKVSAIARGGDSTYADAIYDIAAGDETEFTLEDWHAILDQLDASKLSVRAWLSRKGLTQHR